MIKKIYLLLYFVSFFCFSQNKTYNELINDAELEITAHNFSNAVSKYSVAFESTTRPKIIDLINALKCSCLSEVELNEKFLVEIFDRGLNYQDLINDDDVLRKCLKKNRMNDIKISKGIDTFYRGEINKIDLADQHFRIKSGSYSKYRTEIDSLDYLNIKTLTDLIKIKGFPSEDKIGVQNIGGYQGWHIVLWHYQQQRSVNINKKDITFLLTDALISEHITPQLYARYVEIQNDKFYPNYHIEPLIQIRRGHFRIFKSVIINKNLINIERQKIGLCSLKDQITKIFYLQNNKHQFNFGFSNGFHDLTNQNKRTKKLFYKKSIIINMNSL